MSFICIICRDLISASQVGVVGANGNSDAVVTKCGHLYHLNCLTDWFDKRDVPRLECPLCKSRIGTNDYQRIFPSGDEETEEILNRYQDARAQQKVNGELKQELDEKIGQLIDMQEKYEGEAFLQDILRYELSEVIKKEVELETTVEKLHLSEAFLRQDLQQEKSSVEESRVIALQLNTELEKKEKENFDLKKKLEDNAKELQQQKSLIEMSRVDVLQLRAALEKIEKENHDLKEKFKDSKASAKDSHLELSSLRNRVATLEAEKENIPVNSSAALYKVKVERTETDSIGCQTDFEETRTKLEMYELWMKMLEKEKSELLKDSNSAESNSLGASAKRRKSIKLVEALIKSEATGIEPIEIIVVEDDDLENATIKEETEEEVQNEVGLIHDETINISDNSVCSSPSSSSSPSSGTAPCTSESPISDEDGEGHEGKVAEGLYKLDGKSKRWWSSLANF